MDTGKRENPRTILFCLLPGLAWKMRHNARNAPTDKQSLSVEIHPSRDSKKVRTDTQNSRPTKADPKARRMSRASGSMESGER